jgi:hypothetical protein
MRKHFRLIPMEIVSLPENSQPCLALYIIWLLPYALEVSCYYHNNAKELSFVLQGVLGAFLVDELVIVDAGSWS